MTNIYRDNQGRVIRPVWTPKPKPEDWRTKKEEPPTGYNNPVDDSEYLKTFWRNGGKNGI
jgi:hypothetical protein